VQPSGPDGLSVLVVAGRVTAADLPRLRLALAARLAEAGAGADVICDVRSLARADAAALDVLARLQLAARRMGGRIRLRGASRELRDLLAFTGLSDALPVEARLSLRPLQPCRQPEQREEPLGVEEGVDPDDPPV
jgi:anti-anti-sigma factor